ncbi:hypothetical protein TTHERM_00756500 (macronuclear) [Tetrahymena thermophila SB210]|uniref:Uncharacterized protein n=1 Tax=Tetrahymena thermophila (strain SB210) TaxID=312017 RepID=I7MFP5_TETTS|nr:hypothetical protein TTHERM_00756500 [Tetrahymena thermophila SB210]EAR84102.2 hypothetical protein TTHERM_00756500 [Tetrahymena thermophila SB210]|eukprot:XP_001031765.2 hypothetical protein TTHERM_00756500 [Tetrahymena thermophila SB210]
MEVEQTQNKQPKKMRLFELGSTEDKKQVELFYLQQLEQLPEDKYAESASEKLKHYLESKKLIDTSQYYESKYKPLEQNDISNSDEAYQKQMNQAKILEYGSNFDPSVYDPNQVIQNEDELLDSILKKSVSGKSALNQFIKTPSQPGQNNGNIPFSGPQAIVARFSGYSTTVKNVIPSAINKQ